MLSVVTANLSLCAPGTHSIIDKLVSLTTVDIIVFYGNSEVLFDLT